ncbi:TonB-dependent receptor plug domain-containing protein [Sabulicella glaciei]|uniref:TonB-dependent receptor n=1 Tax=Sabulicella glaciei TaxID=2984948 RepID=A0ABT3NVQ5_9PROT|nr:TonB-dependent receptor [Roseococcus sp. MDT2-1-1]MCW8085958.1 TonB-dependent receptor [Roseococcus sp. MDT2-1-1]
MRRLSLAAALLAAGPAAAQVALPDTIVTATRAPTALERVPAAITVITRQTIEERGFQTLAEALEIVPGLRIAASGGIGQQSSVFLRGNSSRSTLVLLDGVPVNDPAEANGAFNFGNELLFDVERIEVLRGPASSLYGGSALGGVINLVTRRAPPDRAFLPYGEIAGGTQRTLRAGAGVTGTVGQFDYLASVNSLSTEGFNATASRFQRTLNERDGFRGTAATARLGWAPLFGTRVEALLRWRENRFGLDSVPRDDPNFTGDDRRWFGQLRGETTLFGGAWTTGLRIAHGSDRRVYSNLPDGLSAATGIDRYLGERTTVDWGNTVRLPGFGAFSDGQASFGVTHARESARSIAGAVPFQTRVNARQDVNAGHAAVQYRVWERLDLSAGLRHDAAGGFSDTTWRVGAVLQVPELNMRLRAAGGSAFNAPALFQRFGAIGTSFRGNPNLRPERSLGYEVGTELDIPAFGRPAFATLSAAFFQSRVTDLINYNAQFSTLVNVDRVAIKGAELGVALRPARWLSAELSWTITDATDRATGRPLPRRPEHVINATMRVEPLPGLVIAPTLLFTGRSPEGPFASYTDAGASIAGPRRNKSGTVLNITASYRVTPQVTAFLGGRNLGGSKWEPVNGFQVPGRSLLVGTRFSF